MLFKRKKSQSFFDKYCQRENGPHVKPIHRIIEGDRLEAERTMIENEGLETVEDFSPPLMELVESLKSEEFESGKGLSKAVLIDCKQMMSLPSQEREKFIHIMLRTGRKFGLFVCVYGVSEDLFVLMDMDSNRYGMLLSQVWPFDERT